MEWGPILNGLSGGLVAAILGWLVMHSDKRVPTQRNGWKYLARGWYYHLAFYGSLAFTALMALVHSMMLASDAPTLSVQEPVLIMEVFFGAGALLLWWTAYARDVSWSGGTLCVTRLGRDVFYDMRHLTGIRCDWLQEIVLDFADGRAVRVSPYLNGFDDLADWLSDHVKANSYEATDELD